ncbi:hypothetical protein HID58_056814, partial [Brassica napus]
LILIQLHDVFPSFRGEDVLINFLSHLKKEFKRKGTTPFIDNEIRRGESIGPELIRAIRESKITIILISRSYASSKWCVDELVEIMKCKEELGQTVIPVFYKIDPSDVKKLTGYFGKEDTEKWRHALEKVATIAGYDSSTWDNEAAMIEEIATDVSNNLINSGPSTHMEKMKPLLCLDSNEARMIGIWGPSGIGKSTIARFLFSQHSHDFQLSVFMENIKRYYPRPCFDEYSAQLQLQKEFLSQIINHEGVSICHLGVAQDRVMGSYFKGMHKEWEEELPRLRTRLDGETESILKFSYDALCEEDQALFLHIACFFDDQHIDKVEECMIASTLGREIVRKQSPNEPGRRQFLVDDGDICQVLRNDTIRFRQRVRHLIFTSMASSHDLEVRSSLFAAGYFCEVADDFALVVFGMLHDMVKLPELMPKTRLAAVRSIQDLYEAIAAGGSSNEENLVPFLVSLTKLASRSTHLASELILVYKQCMADASELHQLIAIVEIASHSQIFSSNCLTIIDSALVGEVQNLFNVLHRLVGKHSELRLLVLDKVRWTLWRLAADILDSGIVSLECSAQILTERSYWPAYRAGVYAGNYSAYLLYLMPSVSFKLVNWLRSSGYLPELCKESPGEFTHCVALQEAYMNVGECWGTLQHHRGRCSVSKPGSKDTTSSYLSILLQKLAKEFDMLGAYFVDIDESSSSNITTLSLSCSVLPFSAGIVPFHDILVPFTSQSGVCSRLVQGLIQRLWKVDPETREKLNVLVKENESLNCFHLQPRNHVLRVCGKVKILLTICGDVLACIHGFQNQSNESTFTSNYEMDADSFWHSKYFFNIRLCVGAELFALTSDISKSTPDTISLSLDLCLQLKNIQQRRVPLRLTKLYCLLYIYQTSLSHSYSIRDEDMVEMSNNLFHHMLLQSLERRSKIQVDVSRFPPDGSYQIKWISCNVDQHGSYWNLLPLNGKPVFTVKKAS